MKLRLKRKRQKMERAKRPYEGTDAYEAGRRDAIKDLYDELENMDECFIINIKMNKCWLSTKDDIMEYLRQKIYSNNA